MKKIITSIFLLTSAFAFSQVDGSWQMAPQAGALMVGPGQGLSDWWSNDAGSVTTRACFFDDQFVLNTDGSFSNTMGTDTWLETWQDGVTTEGCGTPVAPHDGSNAATWFYNSNSKTITLQGVGAHLGIPKAINEYELTDTSVAVPDSIVYIVAFSSDSTIMRADISIRDSLASATEEGWWRFTLCRDGNCGVDDIDSLNPAPIDTSNNDTLSLLDIKEATFSIYPNPANEIVNIKYEVKASENRSISILDYIGREVMIVQTGISEYGIQEKSINVSSLSPGMYFVKMQGSEGVELRELIISNK